MRIALSEAGHKVSLARTMGAALFELAGNEFDAIFCDLLLPDGHGYDIIRVVREKSGSPFAVAVSGLPRERCEREAIEAGFDKFLAKPFLPNNLAALLR